MSLTFCRQRIETHNVHLSLISATAPIDKIELEHVSDLSQEISNQFGFQTTFETKTEYAYEIAKAEELHHMKPWIACNGKVSRRAWRDPSRKKSFAYRLQGNNPPQKLEWAFIHRKKPNREKGDSQNDKNIWIFIRNASDPCLPCTFLCKGCGEGRVRITTTGRSPYSIDSEILTENSLECIESVLETNVEVEYQKKGLAWNGYIPREIRKYSGEWFDIALMDYFHRHSGILSNFTYPIDKEQEPETSPQKNPNTLQRLFGFSHPSKNR
jgi:hypothetical protein